MFQEIGFELTRRCNFRCLHCFREDFGPQDISLPLVARLLKEAKAFKVTHAVFTGGEPTLHPQFEALIDLVVSEGFTYHFVTNAWTFQQVHPLLLTPARKAALRGVSISMDGATEETHDSLRHPGSFRRIIQAVSLCRATGIDVVAQMVVNAKNRHEMEQMAVLCGSLGLKRLFFAHLEPTSPAYTKNTIDQGLTLSPHEWRQVEAEAARLASLFSMEIRMSVGYHEAPLFQCRTLSLYSINVNYLGHLSFCCQLSTFTESRTGKDVIVDLNNTSLAEGLGFFVDEVGKLQRTKIAQVAEGRFSDNDQFPCFYCLKYFDKVPWLKDYQESPWAFEAA